MFSTEICFDGLALQRDSICPIVIAEAGLSHFGDMRKALALLDMAVLAGADIFKTQFYYVDDLVASSDQAWRSRLAGRTLSEEEMIELADTTRSRGLSFMCTAHDHRALDFVDRRLNVAAFKVGSGEVDNYAYLEDVLSRGKPVIMSTGMQTVSQIADTLQHCRNLSFSNLALLYCNTVYPTPDEHINLTTIRALRDNFEGIVGYSDHTVDSFASVLSVACGATVVEKHITLERNIPNAQDWKVSCDPSTFSGFVKKIKRAGTVLGSVKSTLSDDEAASLMWATKSIRARIPIRQGEIIEASSIIMKRPGDGLSGRMLRDVLGTPAIKNYQADDLIEL